jgi:hypothetical protein
MNNKYLSGIFSLLVILLFLIVISGCSSPNQASTSLKLVWAEEQGGVIATTDYNRLQKLISFKIVLLNYIPEELKKNPPFLVKSPVYNNPEAVKIHIEYRVVDNPRDIIIEEDNDTSVNWGEDFVPPPSFLNFAGVNVMEVKSSTAYMDSDKRMYEDQYAYLWKQNGIKFDVDVSGYDQTESRKIVESMISQ